MSRRDTPSGISSRRRQLIRSHANEIVALPRGEFVAAEAYSDEYEYADIERSVLRKLKRADIINAGEKLRGGARVYRVPETHRETAQSHTEQRPSPCGCGHSGIHNVPGGGYTCGTDACDVRVTRAEVEF